MCGEVVFEELRPGQEREALDFLERDAVKNLRMVYALRRWGLFNLGLAEQGRFLAARSEGLIRGLLFRDNLGLWRLAAEESLVSGLVRAALDIWGPPRAMAGRRTEVEGVLAEFRELSGSVRRREEEITLLLRMEDFAPRGPERAEEAREEDVESLVKLEMSFQLEYLGAVSRDWEIRLRTLRLVESRALALARGEGRPVAKAEMEAMTPLADELGGVYTLPEFRRRGLAAAVCSLLCARSLSLGKVVRLEARADNVPALSLYRGLGFKELWPHLVAVFLD